MPGCRRHKLGRSVVCDAMMLVLTLWHSLPAVPQLALDLCINTLRLQRRGFIVDECIVPLVGGELRGWPLGD